MKGNPHLIDYEYEKTSLLPAGRTAWGWKFNYLAQLCRLWSYCFRRSHLPYQWILFPELKMKILFMLLATAGIIGFIVVLVYTLINQIVGNTEYHLCVIMALVSMGFIILGVYGFSECKKRPWTIQTDLGTWNNILNIRVYSGQKKNYLVCWRCYLSLFWLWHCAVAPKIFIVLIRTHRMRCFRGITYIIILKNHEIVYLN